MIEHLKVKRLPKLRDGTLLLALTGWMDGGMVSTGTVRRLMEERAVEDVAHVEPDPFYIYNFPGSMEVAALFRPEVRYDDGLIVEYELPENRFHVDAANNLAFFLGREPNLRWQQFGEIIFHVVKELGVSRIIFIGSFGGAVPHTREPRLFGSVSDRKLRPLLDEHGIRPTDYNGPSSFATYLLQQSYHHGVEMLSLAAEIPGYLEGINPVSIEAITRRVARILNLPVNLDKLRQASNEWEAKVSEAVEKDEKLATTIRKLEEAYDNALIDPDAPPASFGDDDDDDEGDEEFGADDPDEDAER